MDSRSITWKVKQSTGEGDVLLFCGSLLQEISQMPKNYTGYCRLSTAQHRNSRSVLAETHGHIIQLYCQSNVQQD